MRLYFLSIINSLGINCELTSHDPQLQRCPSPTLRAFPLSPFFRAQSPTSHTAGTSALSPPPLLLFLRLSSPRKEMCKGEYSMSIGHLPHSSLYTPSTFSFPGVFLSSSPSTPLYSTFFSLPSSPSSAFCGCSFSFCDRMKPHSVTEEQGRHTPP